MVGVRNLSSPEPEVGIVEDIDQKVEATNDESSTALPIKSFSDDLTSGLRALTFASGVGALIASKAQYALSGPISALFMLFATLHNFVLGSRLPIKFKKVVHPLVTCTALTWSIASVFATATGTKFSSMLKAYRTGTLSPFGLGAGDVLLFLLGPAVVSLAISMYDRRKLMKENFKEVVTAVGVSSVGGLFGTAAAVRFLQIASPYLRLSLLSRNITSPLAMAIAAILGADASLAVSMVVVTGLFGGTFCPYAVP